MRVLATAGVEDGLGRDNLSKVGPERWTNSMIENPGTGDLSGKAMGAAINNAS